MLVSLSQNPLLESAFMVSSKLSYGGPNTVLEQLNVSDRHVHWSLEVPECAYIVGQEIASPTKGRIYIRV